MNTIESVSFADGRQLSLHSLMQGVSADLFQSELHHLIAQRLAARHVDENGLRLVLENLIALKSTRARMTTALVWHLDRADSSIMQIRACDDICEILKAIRPGIPSLNKLDLPPPGLFGRGQVGQILIKAILHRLFRLLSRPPAKGAELIRAWVEITEILYPNLMPTGAIRIFPFPYGIGRQAKFIATCRKRNRAWSLDGLPYSIPQAIKVFFSSDGRESALARLEYDACLSYAKEVCTWQAQAIHTSDEYEAGAVILHTELMRQKIKSINTAHGVGGYCPNVNYSEFRAFTKEQGEFYKRKQPALRVTLRPQRNSNLPFSLSDCLESQSPAFVLIHQNFNDFSMAAEQQALERLGKLMLTAAKASGVRYFVKLHPNTRPSDIGAVAQMLGGAPLLTWQELKGYRPIFVLINSTTYFELIHVAPVLVYSAPSFIPELYFGQPANIVTENDCIMKLQALVEPQHWGEAVDLQMNYRENCETSH